WIARTVAAAGGGGPAPDARLGGSLAAVTAAALAGCAAVRVHDVFASAQAARVADAMREAGAR
ncbi:MAG: dihydropteroate synthase, partial [Sandaracinaceae bacterium]